MRIYIAKSLELHLFFDRIMKEHALFLKAGFMAKDTEWADKADYFFTEFEKLLGEVVELSCGMVREGILRSEEIVTSFTCSAEEKTGCLTGADINTKITLAEQQLRSGQPVNITRNLINQVRRINQRGIELLNGLIEFKECILASVMDCNLFTANYPLLIQHIIREAKLYCSFLMELEQMGRINYRNIRDVELFWNQIMMEHALFIRGLLDPAEDELIQTANDFAEAYKSLIVKANQRNYDVMKSLTKDTLVETEKYRAFKTAGAEGILNCEITSLILPLLADHVLREANHYLRILKEAD